MSYQGSVRLSSGKLEYVEYLNARNRGGAPSGGWKKNFPVKVQLGLYKGLLSWVFTGMNTSANEYLVGGLIMDDFAPGREPARIQIYGQAEGVTLPVSVTDSSTKKSIATTVIALTNASGAWATITDGKLAASTKRDLFLLGKEFIGHTIFRHMGQVRDSKNPLSSSLLVDGYGRYFLPMQVTSATTRDNEIIRARMWVTGDKGSRWIQTTTVADDVFIYGAVPLAKKQGAQVINVQVAGFVKGAVLPAVTTTADKLGILHDSAANTTIKKGSSFHTSTFAIDSAATAGTKHDLHLLGRIFTG